MCKEAALLGCRFRLVIMDLSSLPVPATLVSEEIYQVLRKTS